MPAQFDTLSYAQELEAAGVPKAQAEVHAKALAQVASTMMVTPADLEAALDALKRELIDKIVLAQVEMKAYVDAAVNRLEFDIASLRAEVKAELRFMKWMNAVTPALVLAQLPLVVALYVR